MLCTSLTIKNITIDKYYDCVDRICKETVEGQYKNDPTCNDECIEPSNNTIIKVMIICIGLGIILTKK